MAAGDIHNHNGSICKADKRPCPFGEEGHSKDVDSYVERKVEEHGVDGAEVRAMIADGTPPADAVEVAKSDLSAVSRSVRRTEAELDADTVEDSYGYIRELTGSDRDQAIAGAEIRLADKYAETRFEVVQSSQDDQDEEAKLQRLNRISADGLAAIHSVDKSSVTSTSNGYEVKLSDGEAVSYDKGFRRTSALKTEVPYSKMDPAVIKYADELAENVGPNAAWIYLRQNGLKSDGITQRSHISKVMDRAPGFYPEPKDPFSKANAATLSEAESQLKEIKAERAEEDTRINNELAKLREDQSKRGASKSGDTTKYNKLSYAEKLSEIHSVVPAMVRLTKDGGYRVFGSDGEVTRYDANFNMTFRGLEN